MIPSVSKYAGQQLLTGAQAKPYANHFIAVHLSERPAGVPVYPVTVAALSSERTLAQTTRSTCPISSPRLGRA